MKNMFLKAILKEVTDSESLISSGRSFQSRGALTAKARPHSDLSRDFGTAWRDPLEDLGSQAGS